MASQWDAWIKLICLLVAFLLAILSLIGRSRGERLARMCRYTFFAALGTFIALTVSYLFFDVYYKEVESHTGETGRVVGTVIDRRDSQTYSSTFAVSLEAEDGGMRALLECQYPSALQIGDRFEAEVTQRAFSYSDGFDEEGYYLPDGFVCVFTCASAADCEILSERDDGLRTSLTQWNHFLSSRLYHAIGGERGALAVALLLGNRTYLDDSTSLDFRHAGISHMLALSGMHVSVLILCLEFLLNRLRIAKWLRAVIVPCMLIGYLLLVGMSPSIVRSVVMVTLLYLGFLLRSDYDSFTALCAILAVLLILTPYAVLDLSLWMSFLAAASIIVFAPAVRALSARIKGIERKPALWRRVLVILSETALIGTVANAALMLLTAYTFGELSWMSVPATVVLAVPMSALLIVSIPALLFPQLSFFIVPCRILSGWMLSGADYVSDFPHVLLAVQGTVEKLLLVIFTVMLILLAVWKCRASLCLFIIPTGMIVILSTSLCLTLTAKPCITRASEETGAFELHSVSGAMVAVDRSDEFLTDVYQLRDAARQERCTEIGDLVLTRYDDQKAYLIHRLASVMSVRRLRLPMARDERERAIAKRLEQEAHSWGIEVYYHTDGLCVSIRSVS